MLSIQDLHKTFGDVTALDGCSLTVQRGQMLGLLGPNGAGKTTAMRAIFGLVRPDAGTLTWYDEPITQPVRRRFGYMPEERGLYPKLPVRWQLAYLGRLHGMEESQALAAANRWLEVFALEERADSKLRDLSHGNQQRVQLIAALIHDPELIVLDEPFTGLDPIGAASMADVLTDQTEAGRAVVFSSHQLDVVEDLCRDAVILDRGRVVLEGSVRALRTISPDRYVEVVGSDQSWTSGLPDVEVIERSEDRMRVRVESSVSFEDVARALARQNVSEFIFEPPPLSEVFRKAVER